MTIATPNPSKCEIEELAVLGGQPIFSELLHVGRPNLGSDSLLQNHLRRILDRRWLTNNGPCVLEFERRVSEHCGVRNCVATSNGTSALEVLVRALGLTGEVIVPAFTFVATAHALQWLGLQPVFCDVDPLTHTLDPRKVEELITERTSAVLGVHVWGQVCDVEALQALCHRHGLKLLFDAAHAFGCARDGRPVGGFGDAEILSFHATKVVQSCEGGAIVTRDPELARRARLMRNFGFEYLDSVVSPGINAKMSELHAAMGLVSLDAMDRFLEANRRNRARYREGLAGIPGIHLHEVVGQEACNDHYLVVSLDQAIFGMSRDQLLEVLIIEGVVARRYFYPGCHRMEPYASQRDPSSWGLRVTESLSSELFQLPTGTAISEMEVDAICELIRFIALHAEEIAPRVVARLLKKY